MKDFILGPLTSFFSKRLYQKALRSGVGLGFGYLSYLTGLFCLVVILLCQFRLLPFTSKFIDWLIDVTPEMTLSSTGINVNAAQPYLVRHPAFGPLYLIDTTKSGGELMADESRAMILIGKDAVVVRNPNGNETRTYDLKPALEQARQANRPPVQITKRMMRELGQRVRDMIIPLILVFLAPFFFIWKLIVVLFYSLVALLLNLFRKEKKFRYPALFTLACYAITPVTVIQAIRISIPQPAFNLNPFYAFALTVAYLLFGMFVTSKNTS